MSSLVERKTLHLSEGVIAGLHPIEHRLIVLKPCGKQQIQIFELHIEFIRDIGVGETTLVGIYASGKPFCR